MTDDVLVEQRDRILIITISRPAARNAIDAALANGIVAAQSLVAAERTTGSGPRV